MSFFCPIRRCRLLACLAALLALAGFAQAQVERPRSPFGTPSSATGEQELDFTEGDFIRGRVELEKSRFFVGEPVVLPLILSNHTRQPLMFRASFRPGSRLDITIQRPYHRRWLYKGPYSPGEFPPAEIQLMPLQEIRRDLVVWASPGRPNGLAFYEPGRYEINIDMGIEVPGAGFVATLDIKPVTVEIVETPDEIKPLVEMLGEEERFSDLQMRRMPKGWEDQLEEVIKGFPPSPLTPYLNYCLANYHYTLWALVEPSDENRNKALLAYVATTTSDSAYRFQACLDFLEFLDTLDKSEACAAIARDMIALFEPNRRIGIGNNPLFQKYLINSAELNPATHWMLLP